MLGQTLGGDKALSTLLTLIRFIMIYLLMILQVPNTRETYPTVTALEKAALGMSQQVFLQAARLLKSLSAPPAIVVTATLWAVVSEFVQ